MKLIKSVKEMQRVALEERRRGRVIAFVPTMGCLHEGHLSLLREGRKRGACLVLSIYVNPTQFAPNEDLLSYPRDLEGDLEKARGCGVDIAFVPQDEDIYPEGFETYVTVERFSKILCGVSRPTHFRGVATIVLKLFNIVMPNIAIFGEKDYQQLKIIQRMVRDLNIPVEVVGMPVVREKDGLAMSSRNRYLNAEEREAALSISRSMREASNAVKKGERDIQTLISIVRDGIESAKIPKIDYIKICDPETLEELRTLKLPARLLAAVYVGNARLIDNCKLDLQEDTFA